MSRLTYYHSNPFRTPRAILISVGVLLAGFSTAYAQTTTINELFTDTSNPVQDTWVISNLGGSGKASIVDLSGLGGNLENNAPGGAGGAFRLTTDFDNNDRAEITTYAEFGLALTTLGSLSIDYSFYKASVPGGNAFAAPAIRLTIVNSSGSGDNYGQLVYEHYWNLGNTSPPTDAWQTVSITNSTGGGDGDSLGGWWWTGGFEIGNSSGGPPLRSLDEWVSAFSGSDIDFLSAELTEITIGVGSHNQGVDSYVDMFSYDFSGVGGSSASFSVSAVPEPSTSATLLAVLALGTVVLRRRPRSGPTILDSRTSLN